MNFSQEAENWDTDERVNRAKKLAGFISNKFSDTNNMKVLEIGCGTGLISTNLRDVFSEIYCFDTSEEMINVLKNKIQKNNYNNMHILSNEEIEKDTYKFDLIYSSMVFHHIENIHNELIKLYTLLKDNGYLIIIDLDEDDGSFHMNEKDFHGHNGFKRDDIKNLLEECNYKDISLETVFNGQKNINGKKVEYSLFLCLSKI